MILVDTHVVVWLAFDPSQLSRKARGAYRACAQERRRVGNLRYTLVELTTLASKGRIHLDISLESFLREVEIRFVVLPITGRACVLALDLPRDYPKDPADRIIGATALAEGLALLTADKEIRKSKTRTRSGEGGA